VSPPDSGAGDEAAPEGDGAAFGGSHCPWLEPPCPSPMPSYANDIAPIIERQCNSCHSGEDGGPWPLGGYGEVRDWATVVFQYLETCTMPPPGTPMPEEERKLFVEWLICDAPNN
jgi:hypothetical protein